MNTEPHPRLQADAFLEAFKALGSPERAADQKAYLKSEFDFCGVTAAQLRAELAYGFLDRHLAAVSGLTLREGSKYLPPRQHEELLERYRAR